MRSQATRNPDTLRQRAQANREDLIYQQELARQRRRERPLLALVAAALAITIAHTLLG